MVSFFLDEAHFEKDTYILFNAVMSNIHQFFQVYERTPSTARKMTEEEKKKEEALINSSPVIKRCRHIQYVLLKKYSSPLSGYLESLGIEPQLYALRWVRLLFAREFHFDDCVILWDAIFAHGSDLNLLDHICVAMLLYINDDRLKTNFHFIAQINCSHYKYSAWEGVRKGNDTSHELSSSRERLYFRREGS